MFLIAAMAGSQLGDDQAWLGISRVQVGQSPFPSVQVNYRHPGAEKAARQSEESGVDYRLEKPALRGILYDEHYLRYLQKAYPLCHAKLVVEDPLRALRYSQEQGPVPCVS
jgi:hypothetical protein